MPVLSEGEEHVEVRWITDCSQKGFPQGKLGVQLPVIEFPTVNQRETLQTLDA
jgi:hypothetical protein